MHTPKSRKLDSSRKAVTRGVKSVQLNGGVSREIKSRRLYICLIISKMKENAEHRLNDLDVSIIIITILEE